MKIKEVETLLGIPRATIRFYERNGLLLPDRTDNSYRSYSDKDVAELRRIIMLRKLGISVEDIKDLQDGAVELSQILDENIIKISEQLSELSGALNMCRKMKEQKATMEELYSVDYWNLLKREEEAGHPFMQLTQDMLLYGKHIFLSSFDMEDCEGGSLYSVKEGIVRVLGRCLSVGGLFCLFQCLLFKNEWSWKLFLEGFKWPFVVTVVMFCVELPEFLIGRKWPQKKAVAKKIRNIIFYVSALLLLLICIYFVWIENRG